VGVNLQWKVSKTQCIRYRTELSALEGKGAIFLMCRNSKYSVWIVQEESFISKACLTLKLVFVPTVPTSLSVRCRLAKNGYYICEFTHFVSYAFSMNSKNILLLWLLFGYRYVKSLLYTPPLLLVALCLSSCWIFGFP